MAPKSRVDSSYFKAVLLYALSQVRIEPFRGDARGTLKDITAYCRTCLHRDYRSAMLNARINHDIGKMANNRSPDGHILLPAFDGNGVMTAAALNCLVEGGMQMLQGGLYTLPGDSAGGRRAEPAKHSGAVRNLGSGLHEVFSKRF